MEESHLLALHAHTSLASLRRHLAPGVRLRETAPTAEYQRRTYLDTFDWRLLDGGKLLYIRGDESGNDTLVLSAGPAAADITAPGEGHLEQPAGDLLRRLPLFPAELPPGAVADDLRNLGNLRALLQAARCDVTIRRFSVLDELDKTIGRLGVETSAPGQTILRLTPLRGFAREATAVVRAAAPAARRVDTGEALHLMAAGAERTPGAYSTRVDLVIDPDAPAGSVTARVLGYFLSIMRENEAGVRQQTDTEFLHDYRIALRRLRSYASIAKNTLEPKTMDALKADLKTISGYTGPARDLDVLLLRAEEYRAMLPPELEPGLEELFEWARGRTREAYDELAAFLDGPEYGRIMARWQDLGAGGSVPPELRGPDGSARIGEVGPAWLRRRVKRVAAGIDAVETGAPDERMHRLRIDGKKLRYLLEIHSSLYPQKPVTRLVKHLKKFQDALGDWNDVSVQEQTLQDDLARMSAGGGNHTAVAASIGGLLTQLRTRRAALGADYHRAAARFRSEIRAPRVSRMIRSSVHQGGS